MSMEARRMVKARRPTPTDYRRAAVIIQEFCSPGGGREMTNAVLRETAEDGDGQFSALLHAIMHLVSHPDMNPNREVWAAIAPQLAMMLALRESQGEPNYDSGSESNDH